MEIVIAILGEVGVVVAILANTTSIVKFAQEQRERKKTKAQPALNDASPATASNKVSEPPIVDNPIAPQRAVQPLSHPKPSSHILTPDQRLRVFVSSTLQEVAEERAAVKAAISNLRLSPVMFELGARPHPPRELYRAYLEQSHIFVGIYWQRYGWVAPGETMCRFKAVLSARVL